MNSLQVLDKANELLTLIELKGGFTLKLDGSVPTEKHGFMVSFPSTETVCNINTLLPMDIVAAVRKCLAKAESDNYTEAQRDNLHIGAWLDNGKVYFDLSERIYGLSTAVHAGKARKQLAIYDVMRDTVLPLRQGIEGTPA